MIIKNYPQFSKKTFFLGVDRQYFLYFVIFQVPIYFIFLFTTTALISIVIIVISYIVSIISFAKDNYFLEKVVIPLALKIRNILPR